MSVAVKPEQFGVSREGLFSSPSGPVEFAPGLERRVLLGSWPVVVQCWVCVGHPGRSQTGVGYVRVSTENIVERLSPPSPPQIVEIVTNIIVVIVIVIRKWAKFVVIVCVVTSL